MTAATNLADAKEFPNCIEIDVVPNLAAQISAV